MQTQKIDLEAGFSFDTATKIIADLTRQGFNVTARTIDNGKVWSIVAYRTAPDEPTVTVAGHVPAPFEVPYPPNATFGFATDEQITEAVHNR